MKYRVELAASAERAIKEQARYIAEDRESPLAAVRWLRRILKAKDGLSFFPHRCPHAPENALRDYEIRMQIVGDFLLLYNVDEQSKTVRIIAARHARRQALGDLPEAIPGD